MYQNAEVEKAPLKNSVISVSRGIYIWFFSCHSFLFTLFFLISFFAMTLIHLFIHKHMLDTFYIPNIMSDHEDRELKICYLLSKSLLPNIGFLGAIGPLPFIASGNVFIF